MVKLDSTGDVPSGWRPPYPAPCVSDGGVGRFGTNRMRKKVKTNSVQTTRNIMHIMQVLLRMLLSACRNLLLLAFSFEWFESSCELVASSV